MKKISLSVAMLLFASITFGQLTITPETHTIPQDLSYFMLRTVNLPEFDPGEPGADQVWDLSEFGGVEVQYDYVDPELGLEAENFPEANLLEGIFGTETYMQTGDNGMEIIGQTIPGQVLLTYNDSRIEIPFPFNYQDTLNDTFTADGLSLVSTVSFEREGEVEIIADGYGTLILPFDTLENVLRVRSVGVYSDFLEGELAGTVKDTVYSFYHDSVPFPVANFSIFYLNDIEQQNEVSYASEEALTPVSVREFTNSDLKIYPNPANDYLSIDWTGGEVDIQVLDMKGRQVIVERNFVSRSALDLSDLEPGTYLIKLISENEIVTRKFIVD